MAGKKNSERAVELPAKKVSDKLLDKIKEEKVRGRVAAAMLISDKNIGPIKKK